MHRVNVIADVGSNHDGQINKALELIRITSDVGANTVKFQLFTADTLWHSSDARHNTIKAVVLPEYWLPALKAYADSLSIEFLCTPFSPHAVEVLEKLKVKRYKIASGDVTYLPLLEVIAETGKPVVMSTGFSTFDEIDKALEVLSAGRTRDVILLHCVGAYPTLPDTANLPRILDLIERYTMPYGYPVGLSSHLKEWWVDIAAVAYKIHTIEKHIDSYVPGIESKHSLNPMQFIDFVQAVRDMEGAMNKTIEFSDGERYAQLNYRRDPSDWLRPMQDARQKR